MRRLLVFLLFLTTTALPACDRGAPPPQPAKTPAASGEKRPTPFPEQAKNPSAPVAPEAPGLPLQEQRPVPATMNPSFKILLAESLVPTMVETSAEALEVWREAAPAKPTLILISNNPLLGEIPAAVRAEVKSLLATGTAADFDARMAPDRANPLLLPYMALSAALEQGYFSRVIWMLPLAPAKDGDLTPLRETLLATGDISRDEATSLSFQNGRLSGMIRSTPFEIIPFDRLPKLSGPVFVHIETGFFSPLYSNEIKTPIYKIVIKLLTSLRAGKYQATGVTLNYGNRYYDLPLRVRFLGNFIGSLLKTPAKLDRGPDEIDVLRSEALYLENFLRKDDIRDRYLGIAAKTPGDADINYDLYEIAKRYKEGTKALGYLDKAVAADSDYALEYLQLAGQALDARQPDQAVRMLQMARKTFPDNPFILLNLADVYLKTGQSEKAAPLLESLGKLPWSATYHAKIPGIIEGMKKAAAQQKPKG